MPEHTKPFVCILADHVDFRGVTTMKKLFDNPKKAVVLIILVILTFAAYKQASATEMEVGPTYTSQFNGGIGLSIIERFGPVDLGVSLIGKQEWENVEVENNGVAWAAFVAERPEHWWTKLPAEVHIGTGLWFQKDRSPITSCHATFLLGLKWRLGDHASVGIRHWSNAGVCDKNRGQDVLTFGWRF